jgi:hypothetical protein
VLVEEKLQKLRKEVANLQLENTKLMWKYANWQWRFIIIWGVLSLMFILWKIGSYIGKLIG